MASILIVEHDLDMVRLMRSTLGIDSHDLRVCGDGASALELLTAAPFDLLLLDADLPGRDGVEVCRVVRESEASDHRTIVVMITERHDVASRLRAFSVGADDYLLKPLDGPELRTRVERWLDVQQMQIDLVMRRRREAIREIVTTICHELNNPLAAAVMGVDLVLRRGNVPPESSRDLGIVRDNLERISGILAALQLVEDRTVPYVGNRRMIDFQRRPDSE